MLIITILLFLVGLALLLFGADKVTDAASQLANRLGVHPIIIGVVILSIGTSIPEITNSAISMATANGSVAFGDIIGSDLVQITLILGIVALIRPLEAKRREILFYGAANIVAILLAYFLIRDGIINWVDGLILCIMYILFLTYVVKKEKYSNKTPVIKFKNPWSWFKISMWMAGGFIIVFIGSRLLVNSTVSFATNMGLPTYMIAFIAVGLGTSLPELFVAANATLKKNHALGIGTLLGSNITDPTLSLGFGALFTKGSAVPPAALGHLIFLITATAIIISLFAWKKKMSRPLASLAIVLYIIALIII